MTYVPGLHFRYDQKIRLPAESRLFKDYTEGVGQFQPRVEPLQPWDHECHFEGANPERVEPLRAKPQTRSNPFRVAIKQPAAFIPRVEPWQPWITNVILVAEP